VLIDVELILPIMIMVSVVGVVGVDRVMVSVVAVFAISPFGTYHQPSMTSIGRLLKSYLICSFGPYARACVFLIFLMKLIFF